MIQYPTAAIAELYGVRSKVVTALVSHGKEDVEEGAHFVRCISSADEGSCTQPEA